MQRPSLFGLALRNVALCLVLVNSIFALPQSNQPNQRTKEDQAYRDWYKAYVMEGDPLRTIDYAITYLSQSPEGTYADFLKRWLKLFQQDPEIKTRLQGGGIGIGSGIGSERAKSSSDNEAPTTRLMRARLIETLLEAVIQDCAAANIKIKDGKTILMLAAAIGDAYKVKALISKGSNVDIQEGNNGWTALIYGIWSGNTDTIRALLGNGANAALRDKEGRTAFDHATLSGTPEVMKLLDESRRRRQ